jgi:hypothetical protein
MPRFPVILDTNIYDLIAQTPTCQASIKSVVDEGRIEILVNPTIQRQLLVSPFRGVPDWFSVRFIPESVLLVGTGRVNDRVGSGTVKRLHQGASSKKLPV